MAGLIADAQGVYHDLSKGAFDAFSIKHPSVSKHLSTTLLNQPVIKGIQKLANESGIDISKYEELDYQGAASALAKLAGNALGIGSAAAAGAAATAGIGTVAAAAGLAIPTGGLALVGVAIEAGLAWAVKGFETPEYQPGAFNRGDWVVVDDGQKTVASVDREIDLGMSEMFDDAPTISELHVFNRVEAFHVGFYVSPGQESASSTIFNILTGETHEHFNLKIRKLPFERRAALDADSFASKVRELYFTKHDNVRLECEVSCDPGTEVIFKDELWNIVKCDGDVALIEAGDGRREQVPMVSLGRSRQERYDTQAWRYNKGEAPTNNSFAVTPGGYGTGDWVWVRQDVDWELAMVHIISGSNAVVYMTQSGFQLEVPVEQVRVASRDISDLYNRVNDFVVFKLAAVEGRTHDTRRLRLPAQYRSIVRDVEPAKRVDPKHRVEEPTFTAPRAARPVESKSRAADHDFAEQNQNLTGIRNTQNLEAGIDEAQCRRRMMGTKREGDLCRERESSPYGGAETFGESPKRYQTDPSEVYGETGRLIGGGAVILCAALIIYNVYYR